MQGRHARRLARSLDACALALGGEGKSIAHTLVWRALVIACTSRQRQSSHATECVALFCVCVGAQSQWYCPRHAHRCRHTWSCFGMGLTMAWISGWALAAVCRPRSAQTHIVCAPGWPWAPTRSRTRVGGPRLAALRLAGRDGPGAHRRSEFPWGRLWPMPAMFHVRMLALWWRAVIGNCCHA